MDPEQEVGTPGVLWGKLWVYEGEDLDDEAVLCLLWSVLRSKTSSQSGLTGRLTGRLMGRLMGRLTGKLTGGEADSVL